MQKIKQFFRLLLIFGTVLGLQGSCPSNYTTVTEYVPDGSGNVILFSVCYPTAMLVGNQYNIYLTIENMGSATSNHRLSLYGYFAPSGLTSINAVVISNPSLGYTNFNNTASAPDYPGVGQGWFGYTNGIVAGGVATGIVTAQASSAGLQTYNAIGAIDESAVEYVELPMSINIIDTCPAITPTMLTGCASGNLNTYVTGGAGPYTFTQIGTAVGGTVEIDSDGDYLFSNNSGSFQYLAKDVAGCTGAGTLNVSSPSLPTGSVLYNLAAGGGGSLTQSIGTTGGTPPYTYNQVGTAINGVVTFNAEIDEFTFTQTSAGASRFRFYVTDANGCQSAERSVYFYSCPTGGTASAALGNNNAEYSLIYAVCYPDSVGDGDIFNATISLININTEGSVPSGTFVDFIPDPSQGVGLSYVSAGAIPSGVTFDPSAPSAHPGDGGMGSATYPASVPVSTSYDFTVQLQANVEGLQSYTAWNVFNPGNPLAPAITIQVGALCTIVAGTEYLDLCANAATTGSLIDLVSDGVLPYTFGPTGSAIGGQVSITPSGVFTFTASPGFTGAGQFIYEVVDTNGCSATGAVDITVASPSAGATSVNTCLDTAINGDLSSLVTGGFPPYTYSATGTPVGGNLLVFGTGLYYFVPDFGFSGPAGFEYQVTDSNACVATADVSITVDSLSANSEIIQTCYSGLTGTLLDYVNGGIGALIFTGPLSAPSCGTVTIAPDGSFVYNAPFGYTGPCDFAYEVSDGIGCSATGALMIVASSASQVLDSAISSCADRSVDGTLANLIVGDQQPPFTFAIVTQPVHGTITNFDSTTGTYTYVPSPGYIGTDSFQFQVTDGNGCVSNVGTITVSVVSCCPLSSNPLMQLILEMYWGFSGVTGL